MHIYHSLVLLVFTSIIYALLFICSLLTRTTMLEILCIVHNKYRSKPANYWDLQIEPDSLANFENSQINKLCFCTWACDSLIVFVNVLFIFGYTPEKRAEDDFLRRWRDDFRERSIQLYVIYGGESYQKDNIYEKWLKNNLING
uniref:Uncharacterized protein n=1 Tax=Romanomermis culicivorax TaxID=13658 RepID=A0A915KL62_ROMCU